MNSLLKSGLIGVTASLVALWTGAALLADDTASGQGQTNGVPSSWNNYPTKNMGYLNGTDTADNPQAEMQNPSLDTQNPQTYPPRWPIFPPQQQQSKPKPPGFGKRPHVPVPPPGFIPPGVQWNKPSGGSPGQQGMLLPNQMDPEFLKWLNQIYELWQQHQEQQNGMRPGGPAGSADGFLE